MTDEVSAFADLTAGEVTARMRSGFEPSPDPESESDEKNGPVAHEEVFI